MVFMRLLPTVIIPAIFMAGCAKKEQHAVHPALEPSKTAAAQDTGKAFGKYFSNTQENSGPGSSRKTFSMRKQTRQPAAPPPTEKEPSAKVSPNFAAAKPNTTMPQPGRPPVANPAPRKAPANVQGSAELSSNGKYVVQVACAATVDDAYAIAEKFKKMGFPAYVLEVSNPVSGMEGTYYRVRIGNFRTRANANAFGERNVKPEGYDFWVDYKANEAPAQAPASVVFPPPSSSGETKAATIASKASVPAGGTPSAVPATLKPAPVDLRLQDTGFTFRAAKPAREPVKEKQPGYMPVPAKKIEALPLKADSSKAEQPKSGVMQSPLNLLLKVYDTGSAKTARGRTDTTPAMKRDSASVIPAFIPPAPVESSPSKSGAGSRGGR